MREIVDARGLSCPQPVLDTLNRIKSLERGTVDVLVDTEAAKENVSRAAQAKGWALDGVTEDGGEYRITISKR